MKYSQRGFTLIEMMIAVAILATLSVLAATSIQQAIKSKAKIQGKIDDVSKMRDVLRIMERDVQLAYHYRDIPKEIEDLVKKKNKQDKEKKDKDKDPKKPNPEETEPPETPEQIEAPPVDPSTHFIGEENQLHFVTMNSARMIRNAIMADFIEVGYFLKECSIGGERTNCLYRRNANYVDQDPTKGGTEFPVLDNVTEFQLKYIGKGKQDWVNSWKTDKGGDAATKNNFPTAVQISLTVEKGKDSTKKKKYSMQTTVGIHFPNNKEESGDSKSSGTTP